MTKFTYTTDLPSLSTDDNKKLRTKLPRSILLPPYLASNPYFVQLMDAVDEVFDSTIEFKLWGLENLRNMWVTSAAAELAIADGQMLDETMWSGVDRQTVVQQVNMLGMKIAASGVLPEQGYRSIARNLGQYWFDKGKNSCIDFLNYCCGLGLSIDKLWTTDYKTFVSQTELETLAGQPIYYDTTTVPGGTIFQESNSSKFVHSTVGPWSGGIGQSLKWIATSPGQSSTILPHTAYSGWRVGQGIHSVSGGWTGGVGHTLMLNTLTDQNQVVPATNSIADIVGNLWYPTTHVRIVAPWTAYQLFTAPVLANLFNEISNNNLVLESIVVELESLTVVGRSNESPIRALAGLVLETEIMLSTTDVDIDGVPTELVDAVNNDMIGMS